MQPIKSSSNDDSGVWHCFSAKAALLLTLSMPPFDFFFFQYLFCSCFSKKSCVYVVFLRLVLFRFQVFLQITLMVKNIAIFFTLENLHYIKDCFFPVPGFIKIVASLSKNCLSYFCYIRMLSMKIWKLLDSTYYV